MSIYQFAKSGQIEIQGRYALNLITLNDSAVEFEIIGLSKPKIHLIDKRPEVKKMTARLLKSGRVDQLAQYFNKPALIKVFPTKRGKISVLLEKTRSRKPRHMLWVAVGIRGRIPYYENHVRLQVERIRKNTFSVFCLFRQDKN